MGVGGQHRFVILNGSAGGGLSFPVEGCGIVVAGGIAHLELFSSQVGVPIVEFEYDWSIARQQRGNQILSGIAGGEERAEMEDIAIFFFIDGAEFVGVGGAFVIVLPAGREVVAALEEGQGGVLAIYAESVEDDGGRERVGSECDNAIVDAAVGCGRVFDKKIVAVLDVADLGGEVVAVQGDAERRGSGCACGVDTEQGDVDAQRSRAVEGHAAEVQRVGGSGEGAAGGVGDGYDGVVLGGIVGDEEVIGFAIFEEIVVFDAPVAADNPHSVTGNGIADAEVVGAGWDGDGLAAVEDDMRAGEIAFRIGGDGVFEVGEHRGGYIAVSGHGAGACNGVAVEIVVGI